MRPSSEQVWILTNILNSVLDQKGVKNQLYGGKREREYSLCFASLKVTLQPEECGPELSIQDWVFLNPKEVFLAAGDKNCKVSVQQKESFSQDHCQFHQLTETAV